MYKLESIAILHKSYVKRELTPADILDYIRYGYKSDGRFVYTKPRSFGEYYTLTQAKNALRDIPDVYFQTYLEGTYDDKYHYVYEGILLSEDDKPILYYNEK